jgi:Mitochondrial carrier protein
MNIFVVCVFMCSMASCYCDSLSESPNLQKKKREIAQMANFIAGGIAGSISSTMTAPLEVIKTQLQSSQLRGRYTHVYL